MVDERKQKRNVKNVSGAVARLRCRDSVRAFRRTLCRQDYAIRDGGRLAGAEYTMLREFRTLEKSRRLYLGLVSTTKAQVAE